MTDTDDSVGLPSMRIGGKTLDELSMVPAAHAKQQLPAFMDTDRENKIAAIKARYPRPAIAYIDSRLREARENIDRIGKLRSDEQQRIDEYTAQIALCKHRDKRIASLDPDMDSEQIRQLKLQFPPYNVVAMQQQIEQSREALMRCDDVVGRETDSIAELHEARALCLQRDAELKKLGAAVE